MNAGKAGRLCFKFSVTAEITRLQAATAPAPNFLRCASSTALAAAASSIALRYFAIHSCSDSRNISWRAGMVSPQAFSNSSEARVIQLFHSRDKTPKELAVKIRPVTNRH